MNIPHPSASAARCFVLLGLMLKPSDLLERSHIHMKPWSEEAAERDAASGLTGDDYTQTWCSRSKSPKLCLIGTWRRGGGIKAHFL